MPRTIEISVPAETADEVLDRVRDIPGVVGLARNSGASISPPGDVLTVHVANDAMRPVLRVLSDLEVHHAGSIRTTEPKALLTPEQRDAVEEESNETVWEEMAFMLREDTNVGPNYLAQMALAGAIAAVGLWSDTLHIVVGSMVVAPGFEPLVRVPFGLIAGPRRLSSRGASAAAVGYVAMGLAAALAVLVLQVVDPSQGTDLEARSWVRFWSTVTPTGALASAFAAAAGAVVVSGQRSVLTTGVMIALALIPSMAVAGMALGVGDLALAGRGLVRWGVDVALVVVISALVFGLKQGLLHRRRALR